MYYLPKSLRQGVVVLVRGIFLFSVIFFFFFFTIYILISVGWRGWWLKACLFDPSLPETLGVNTKQTRALYIDIDSVITGPLNEFFLTRYSFGTLSPCGMVNEGRSVG